MGVDFKEGRQSTGGMEKEKVKWGRGLEGKVGQGQWEGKINTKDP